MIKVILLACPLIAIENDYDYKVVNLKKVTSVSVSSNNCGPYYHSHCSRYLDFNEDGKEKFSVFVESSQNSVASKDVVKKITKRMTECLKE